MSFDVVQYRNRSYSGISRCTQVVSLLHYFHNEYHHAVSLIGIALQLLQTERQWCLGTVLVTAIFFSFSLPHKEIQKYLIQNKIIFIVMKPVHFLRSFLNASYIDVPENITVSIYEGNTISLINNMEIMTEYFYFILNGLIM